jgi:PAS domain S-box-containing protein
MAPSTALAFILLGIILLRQVRRPLCGWVKAGATAVVAGVAVFGLLEGLEYFAGVDLTFEAVLFPSTEKLGPVFINRMSPLTGIIFTFSGVALLLIFHLKAKQAFCHVAGGLGSLVALAGATGMMGYLYGTPLLYGSNVIPIAITTSLAFFLLGIGLFLTAGPDCFPLQPLVGPTARARLLRVFLPLTVSISLVYGLSHDVLLRIFDLNRALLDVLVTLTFATVTGLVVALAGKIVGSAIDKAQAESRQARKAREESEEKFRAIVATALDAIISADARGNIIFWNQSAQDVFGYSPEEVLGEPLTLLMPASYRPAHQLGINQLSATGQSHVLGKTVELKGLRKDGSEFPLELSLTTWKIGEAPFYTGIIRDISARKLAEEEILYYQKTQSAINALLRLSLQDMTLEEFLDRVIDLILSNPWLSLESKGCIFLVDDQAQVLVMQAQRSLATEIQETCARIPFGKCLCGRAALTKDIQFSDHIDHRHEINYTGMEDHGHFCIPVISTDKVLGVLSLYLRAGHSYSAKEKDFLTAIANTLAGVIERKQAEHDRAKLEAQLRQAHKMEAIGTLAGGIAHDFNNILGIIMGYAELALLKISGDDPLTENLQQVIRASHRAKDLVKQILTFSRQSEYTPQPLQPALIIKEVLKMLRASLPSAIEIRSNLTSNSLVEADPTQIHQVIMNLCTNAGHAMRENGGILEVSLRDVEFRDSSHHPDLFPGSYVQLSISDTGHGMTPEVRERIFEPFFTTKGIGEGTGLGLSVVHGIIKSYQGAITVYSEPGQGTTFNIYLPRLEDRISPETQAVIFFPGGKERILFVDDEEALAELGRQALEHLGYAVVSRCSSVEALKAFAAQPEHFDLVITDQTMPQMTGTKLAQELLRLRPDLPIILCTGFSESISAERAKEIGIKDYIMKPLVISELAKTIRRVLDTG